MSSKTIYDTPLIDLLPENLRSDPDIIAASQAVDKEFFLLAESIKNVLTYADIDNASEAVVDMLAVELNVDFYDKSLSLDDRRESVKEAILIHQMNGTKAAMLRVFELLQMRGTIEEWFEYDGDPYTFKISILEIRNRELTKETDEMLSALIERHKNVRSHLIELKLFLTNQNKTPYYASTITSGEEITVYPPMINEVESHGKEYIGPGLQVVEIVTV